MNAPADRFQSYDGDEPMWIPPIPLESAPHFDRIQAKLEVVKRAQEDRRDGLPRATDTELNFTQDEIQQTAVDAIRQMDGNLNERFTAVSGYMINDDEEISSKARLHTLDTELALIIKADEPLMERAVDYVAANAEREAFVRQNRLSPPAHYEEHLSIFVMVLVLTMIIESCMNALVLKDVNGYGLIGALGVALFISAVNLGLGLAGGVGWRLLGHIRPNLKAFGVLVTVLATAGALGCNLVAAHYRQFAEDSIARQGTASSALDNALTPGKSTNAAELFASAIPRKEQLESAFRHLRESGLLGFSSLWSWVLLAAGIGIFFAVCYKSWDDYGRYWGYRSRDLRRKRTKAILDGQLRNIEDYAFENIEEKKAACDDAVRALERKAAIALRVATQAERRHGEMMALVQRWGQTINQLIKLYRQTNAQGCTHLPPYWNTYWPDERYKELVLSESVAKSVPRDGRLDPPIKTIRDRSIALKRILENSREGRDQFTEITEDSAKAVPGRVERLRALLMDRAAREVATRFPRAS